MPHKYSPEKRTAAFWAKVDPCRTDGCMIWIGAIKKNDGYGYFKDGTRAINVHLFLVGKAPDGLEWDHLCRNRACIWPEHLEAVTHQINVLRGTSVAARHAVKTHCPQGHPYDLFNTHNHPNGSRRCRTCDKLRHQLKRSANDLIRLVI